MLNSVLMSELREKAGSDSYNRYEFQVHWIVYHMLNKFNNGLDFLIFCEFHDDMAECNNPANPDCMEFFQIKTKRKTGEWTLNSLFKRNKKRDGTYKHSFLGFIFYNFLKFKAECSSCYFISNRNFDDDILTWQSLIRDEKSLTNGSKELYDSIKQKVREEFTEVSQDEFNIVFDRFIQNTFIEICDLPLETYDKHIKGEFFEIASKFNLNAGNGYRLLSDIINLVRQKSKKLINTPISFTQLVKEKGISSNIFTKLQQSFDEVTNNKRTFETIECYLKENDVALPIIKFMLRKLQFHHQKLLDVSDTLYIDTLAEFVIRCEAIISDSIDMLVDFSKVERLVDQVISEMKLPDHQEIDINLLRGVFYETLLST